MQANERLTIAIQKKGRLNEESLSLLQRCGLNLRISKSSLFYSDQNLPIDILFVRDDDIPNLIDMNVSDVGIVGENCLQEQEYELKLSPFERLINLKFGQCRLSIAVPINQPLTSVKDLQNKTIATSYPNLLQNFLKQNNLKAYVVKVSGSVEIAPQVNMADAICDLVSTGRTLEENNLKEEIVLLQSQAVLFKSEKALNPAKQEILSLLINRLEKTNEKN